jgi:hypothetical protein
MDLVLHSEFQKNRGQFISHREFYVKTEYLSIQIRIVDVFGSPFCICVTQVESHKKEL